MCTKELAATHLQLLRSREAIFTGLPLLVLCQNVVDQLEQRPKHNLNICYVNVLFFERIQ